MRLMTWRRERGGQQVISCTDADLSLSRFKLTILHQYSNPTEFERVYHSARAIDFFLVSIVTANGLAPWAGGNRPLAVPMLTYHYGGSKRDHFASIFKPQLSSRESFYHSARDSLMVVFFFISLSPNDARPIPRERHRFSFFSQHCRG